MFALSPLQALSRLRRLVACAGSAGLLAACGGGGGEAMGTLRVALTDDPPCYEQVNVTIEKVRVHRSSTAGDHDAGWSEIVLPTPQRVNLRTLTNGVLLELGQTPLPAGLYTQLRLVLAPNTGSDPLANSVKPYGQPETALTTPSGQQSGLKLNVNIVVGENQIADVVLDFDACRSIVPRGASGQYNLKPVIAVTPRIVNVGTIEGWLDAALAGQPTTSVSVQLNGVPVKATPPMSDGKFRLYPVPVGTHYTLVVTAAGRATAAMTGVPVVVGATTTVSTSTVRIVPPAAASSPATREVSGTVTLPAGASASVRALQTLPTSPVTTIEVAWTAADDDSAAYTLSLPVDAPARTAYVANPASIPFTTETAAHGLYRLEAASGTATPKFLDIDVRAPVPPVNFAFP